MPSYVPRILDNQLKQRLQTAGAVVIEGPKASGKTETARQVAASHIYLDTDTQAQNALHIDPSLVLSGPNPRLLDEWQIEPTLWNQVRRAVDKSQTPGQFILTGSSVPNDDNDRHTGAGRFSFLKLRPLTLFESGHSNGAISLTSLMNGDTGSDPGTDATIHDIANWIAAGGWPIQHGRPIDAAIQSAKDYIQQVAHVDVSRVNTESGKKDPVKVTKLIQSLSRNIATEVTDTVLASDAGDHQNPLARNTVASYLEALERLMILENLPAWSPHLRSKRTLRQRSKKFLVDPSLAMASLGATPKRLVEDLKFMGFMFEALVMRDLRVFAENLGGQVFHYRDSENLEVDAIVQLPNGDWGAFEIKLGTKAIDEAANSLQKFRTQIDTEKSGEPKVLGIITGLGYGYKRDDGIQVIPATTLAP